MCCGKKITESENLLKTGVKVTTVAYRFGFSSSQYFATVFKRFTGCTPSAFSEAIETFIKTSSDAGRADRIKTRNPNWMFDTISSYKSERQTLRKLAA